MFSFFYKLILALCFQKYNYNLERGSPYYYEGKITWKLKNDPGKKKKKKKWSWFDTSFQENM